MEKIAKAVKNPTVFYDGGCPMCSREINHYRRLDRSGSIRWIDVSRETQLPGNYGVTTEQALRRFHVLDGDGAWHTGAYGFLELWSTLPYYRRLAFALRKLHLGRLLDAFYRPWADWRWKRRCNDGQCNLSHD
jgi:predicted DCC family thiol-disulfide oxidoreductase YuxK